jgi:predicted AlkP superfamily phosphohydrolase/phosphomutase
MNGLVSIKDRGTLISEISQELKEIKEPETGKMLFSNVFASEDIYSGPLLKHAPDIILDSYASNWNIRMRKHIPFPEKARDKYFVDVAGRRDFGWHSRDGIFVFCGERFVSGRVEIPVHVMDTPAILFHIYGVPIPEDFDGRVLQELFLSESDRGVINYQPGDDSGEWIEGEMLTAQESEDLASHLRALGYLD